jgi:hypothetical protein
MKILILCLLLSSYAVASDQSAPNYLKQLQIERQNTVAESCRASLPATKQKMYYDVDGTLMEARDYCMFLAIEYVRRQLYAPAPLMSTASNTTVIPTQIPTQ